METIFNELSKRVYEANVEKGFYEEPKNIGEMLALIHSEVSEALEAHRKGKTIFENPSLSSGTTAIQILNSTNTEYFNTSFNTYIKDTFEDEIADIMIRCLDLCGYLKIDIDTHIKSKIRFNSLRAYKHGKKY